MKSEVLNETYPVGSIYMSTTISTNAEVESKLGGKWIVWGSGRVPVGVNTGDGNFNTVEKTGGATTHRHDFKIAIRQLYGVFLGFDNGGAYSYSKGKYSSQTNWGGDATLNVNTSVSLSQKSGAAGLSESQGDTNIGSSLQPYITCYMYKRTQ